jgi:AmiR/NasT family two-component response regulator
LPLTDSLNSGCVDMMNSSIRRLYEDLRSIRVVLIYPPGDEREILAEQFKRIGCHLSLMWPFPAIYPTGADVILFQVSEVLKGSGSWCSNLEDVTLIALSDYESPTTLRLLLDSNAHGVITKPFRSSGVLSTLVLARSSQSFQSRLKGKIDKLEDTIKSRRQIEKAIRVITQSQGLTEIQAYEHMRARATKLRVTVADIAAMVLEAQETMTKLGFEASSMRT